VKAIDLGAGDYVTKPFRIEALLARVRSAQRRKIEVDPDHPRHRFTELGVGYRFSAG